VAYGIALPNFLIAGSLYAHTASKLMFVRIFRKSRHLHSHTVLGWGTWVLLVFIMNAAAFVLAVGVPIFKSASGFLFCAVVLADEWPATSSGSRHRCSRLGSPMVRFLHSATIFTLLDRHRWAFEVVLGI